MLGSVSLCGLAPFSASDQGAWLTATAIAVLGLHPTSGHSVIVSHGTRTWDLMVPVDYKSDDLAPVVHDLTLAVRERERRAGCHHGAVLVRLLDHGAVKDWVVAHSARKPCSHTGHWGYRFDRRGIAPAHLPTLRNRLPVPGGVRYLVTITTPVPARPEDARCFLRHHPPFADKRWTCGLSLPHDQHSPSGTKLCRRGPGPVDENGMTALTLDPEVAEWCSEQIGRWTFQARVARMLFASDADRLVFRLRWL